MDHPSKGPPKPKRFGTLLYLEPTVGDRTERLDQVEHETRTNPCVQRRSTLRGGSAVGEPVGP